MSGLSIWKKKTRKMKKSYSAYNCNISNAFQFSSKLPSVGSHYAQQYKAIISGLYISNAWHLLVISNQLLGEKIEISNEKKQGLTGHCCCFPAMVVDIRNQQSNILEKQNLGKLVLQLLCCAAFITTEAASLTHLQALN